MQTPPAGRCNRCAAWSCVEKILQLAQRTSAPVPPSSQSGPLSGSSCAANPSPHTRQRLARRIFVADGHQSRHLLFGDIDLAPPNSASEMSATLYLSDSAAVGFSRIAVGIRASFLEKI